MARWCLSGNEENFFGDYETREQAIAAAKNEFMPGETFYVGECVKSPPVLGAPDAGDIIDRAVCYAADEFGECAETFLACVTPAEVDDLQRRLEEVWVEWIRAHQLEAEFWTIPTTEKLEVPRG